MNRIRVALAVPLVVALMIAAPAFAQNGALKVTSFPSSAQVWIDGANTGKVTPMSASLSQGDHTVTVQIPNSGWNPDTRTITVVAGNNDLSVTLLPVLTMGPVGPMGPKGDKGDPGPTGPQGPSGVLDLAGLACPAGQFVRGFDPSGRIACGEAPTGGGGTSSPIALPSLAQLIADWFYSRIGTEGMGTALSFTAGPVAGSITPTGYAFCLPPYPLAPPSSTPPLYGCAADVHVTATLDSGNHVTLAVTLGHLFLRYTGTATVVGQQVSLDGYIVLAGVQVTLNAALVDAGGGYKAFGPPYSLTVTSASYDLVTDNPTIGSLVGNGIFSVAVTLMRDALRLALVTYLSALPPFIVA